MNVRYYIADKAALAEFAHLEGIRLDDILRIFHEQTSKHATKDGTVKEYDSHPFKRRKIKWMLFDDAAWIQCVGAPHRIFCVGADVDFFVDNVAAMYSDMKFMKADRLRQFLTGKLNNSGLYKTEYTGKSKSDSKWIRMPQAPANALERIPSVPPPSPFAEPASATDAPAPTTPAPPTAPPTFTPLTVLPPAMPTLTGPPITPPPTRT